MKKAPPDSATTITHTLPESGSGTGAPNTLSGDNGTSQVELQALVDRLRSTGMVITITGEGKVVTFAGGDDPAVPKLKIIEGVDAWQYHDNAIHSDCILEIEGLPRMHACADYLSLRSHFFTAMFANPLRESTTRVIQLTPPHPSTFVWALHHLYTGAISHEHKKRLKVALNANDAATFWGLYENANFLECSTLMDECMEVLGAWVVKADRALRSSPFKSQLQLYNSEPGSSNPQKAVFRYPTFQANIVGPAALMKLLRPLQSVSLRLFVILSWLDSEEREGEQVKDSALLPVELVEIINKSASEGIKAGSSLLESASEAFPSVFRRVVTTPELIIPRLEELEHVETEAKLVVAQLKKEIARLEAQALVDKNKVDKAKAAIQHLTMDAELMHCGRCKNKVPRSLMDEEDACITMGHPGTLLKGLTRVWSCCQTTEGSKDCALVRGKHTFAPVSARRLWGSESGW